MSLLKREIKCQRCRQKKLQCDGKKPQCLQCENVGLNCLWPPPGKPSDAGAKRKSVTGSCTPGTRNDPLGYVESLEERIKELESECNRLRGVVELRGEMLDMVGASGVNAGSSRVLSKTHPEPVLNEKNLARLEKEALGDVDNILNGRPVSIAESTTERSGEKKHSPLVSFEQHNAPGLDAARTLANNKNHELAALVTKSVPRSTEEILFVPGLLAQVSQKSMPAAEYIAQCLSSLKLGTGNSHDVPVPQLKLLHSLGHLTREVCDLAVTQFFDEYWDIVSCGLDKDEFLHEYNTLIDSVLAHDAVQLRDMETWVATLVVIVQMGLLSINSLAYQDIMDKNHELITTYLVPTYSSTPTIYTLQFVTAALYYALTTAQTLLCFRLRATVISIAQQLRLHRCPSAVLAGNANTVSLKQQGQRRILFWNAYVLDVFCSWSMGVPRLLKDGEIECALPSVKAASNMVQQVNIVGRVSQLSLNIMRYAKVLGNVLDTIFKRGSTSSYATDFQEITAVHEDMLESWRPLPVDASNGAIKIENTRESVILAYLYYQARLMIHFPVQQATLSHPEEFNPSIHAISQSIRELLANVLSKKYVFPLPLNLERCKVRYTLLACRYAMNFNQDGPLYEDSRTLVYSTLADLKILERPLPTSVLEPLEMAIEYMLPEPHDVHKKRKTAAEITSTMMLPPIPRIPSEFTIALEDVLDYNPDEFVVDGSLALAPWLAEGHDPLFGEDLLPISENSFTPASNNSIKTPQKTAPSAPASDSLFKWQNTY